MSSKLILSLSEQITEKIADPGYILPSISVLASQFGVSYATMWKAVHILVDERIVYSKKGSGIAIPGKTPTRPRHDAPVELLVETIKRSISDGSRVTGEELPKIRFFTLENHSATTVVKAFRQLENCGLIYKKGKKWIVGKPRIRLSKLSGSVQENPVAFFIVLNESYWSSLFRQSFTAPFVSALTSELIKHQVGLSIGTIHTPLNELDVLPTGKERILPIVRFLGNRFCGALMTFFPDDLLTDWIRIMGAFKKPIINFNPTNEFFDAAKEIIKTKAGRYFHLHLDEVAAVRLALEHLTQRGHRTIGVPVYTAQGFEWVQKRVALIKKCAEQNFPNLTILTVNQSEPWWGLHSDFGLYEFVKSCGLSGNRSGQSIALSAKVQSALLKKTPSFSTMLSYDGLTAILALNNQLARKYYYWLNLMDIKIPEQLSLISFDNTPESVTIPITTIDFGFARLGYLAAHILIGDIPVKADRKGNIPGICELIDRGSVKIIRNKAPV